jgi:hypothetical protein
VREILIEEGITLAVAPAEKRLWLHDRTSGIVHVIPVTNFYNELMLHLHIRDPKIALQSSSLFYDPGRYADGDLRSAFIVYNATRHRVDVHTQLARPHENLIETLFEKLGVRRKKP